MPNILDLSHDKGAFLRQERHAIVLSAIIYLFKTISTCSTKVFEKKYEIIKINAAYLKMQVTKTLFLHALVSCRGIG